MDGESRNLNECGWDIERIPDHDFVYRQVPHTEREKDQDNRRYPSESHFSLARHEDSLSVNWSKYIDPPSNFKLIALHFNRNGKFVDYQAFRLFKFPVKYLHGLEEIQKVIHSPVVNGRPAPAGKPNNRAHASVFLDDDVEVRLKLSDYCRENNHEAFVNFDPGKLDEVIQELRKKFDSSYYHNCNWYTASGN